MIRRLRASRRRLALALVLLVGASGCASVKKLPPYEGPFQANHDYTVTGPVSAWLGDAPFESGDALAPVPPQRAVRDAEVLPPGTRFQFVRKDAPYLVFLVRNGDAKGRYAWVDQHSEDIKSFEAVP
jgi:hypothetical protein